MFFRAHSYFNSTWFAVVSKILGSDAQAAISAANKTIGEY
jgi:hypothetical protein